MYNYFDLKIARAVFNLSRAFCAGWPGLMVAVLLMSGCASTKEKDEASLHARIGTALLQQGHYPEALRELLTAEKLDPRNASIQNNLGLAYFMREKPQLSANHLKRSIELDPSFTEARNNYGRLLIELGRYDDAIRELQRVLDDLTYSEPAKAFINMGLARFKKAEYPEARANFSKAIQLDRENCLAQTYYGRTLFESSQYIAAAQALDNAVIVCHSKDGHEFDEAQYYGGLAYYKLGKTSSAISRMEEIVKLSPNGRYAKKAESLLKLMK